MRKHEAKKIIQEERMTWRNIKDILRQARERESYNWEARSRVNSSMTKGTAFNIFWKGIQSKSDDELVSSSRVGFVGANIMIEFGDRKISRTKKDLPPPSHQEPMEINASAQPKEEG